MGVSQSKVCRMEDALDADLSYGDIESYAHALGLDVSLFYDAVSASKETRAANVANAIADMIDKLRSLLPEDSRYGDAIRTAGGEVKMLKGTWKLCAGRDSLAWLSDTLAVDLAAVKAHHDSLAKYRNTVSTELRSLVAQLESLLSREDYPNDSLLHLADSISSVGNARQYSYDSVTAVLSADTVQMDYYRSYIDSLLRHRAIQTEGAPISLGEEAKLSLFVHPDSIK